VHQKDERNKSLVAHSWQLVQLVQLVMISHVLRNFVSKDCLWGAWDSWSSCEHMDEFLGRQQCSVEIRKWWKDDSVVNI